jgi:ABC-type glycerol-3-phosphate transport system permease component
MKVSLFGRIASYIILSCATLFALFPIYWTFITSLRDRVDIFAQVPVFFGGNLSFDNWASVAGDPVFLSALLTTIMVTVIATALTVFAGTLAAYAIARSPKFVGRKSFSSWLIVIRAVPGVVLAVPLYQIVVGAGLYDNPIALAICYAAINLPFSVWLMVGFIQGIPVQIEESARIDGANQFKIFTKVLLPLLKSGLGATTIFVAMLCWNEFLMPLILADQSAKTLPVYVAGFVTSQTINYGGMAAAACLCIVPIAIITIAVQKQLVSGLSLGAVKD